MYDVGRDEWVELEGMPGFRAGCAGFVVEGEFWVMGGYGESRTVYRMFPVDEYCRDVVALGIADGGGKWREVGDMWEQGERQRLGRVAVLDDGTGTQVPGIFMLDGIDIFRFRLYLIAYVLLFVMLLVTCIMIMDSVIKFLLMLL